MRVKNIALLIVSTVVASVSVAAQGTGLEGRWTLNRELSQFPTDVGFGMDLVAAAGADTGTGGSGGGRRGGGMGATAAFRETQFDAMRREQLVDEVQNPPAHLTIRQTDSAVTITDDRGRSRTFHPNGREESQPLTQVSAATTARWEGAGLVVLYKVEQDRNLRYTYTATDNPRRLSVKVEFLERGGHDTVTRVYQPTTANEVVTPAPAPAAASGAPATTPPAAAAPPAPPAAAAAPPAAQSPAGQVPSYFLKQPQGVPAAGQEQRAPVVAGGPDAELKGITNLGVVVEDMGSSAASCGVKQAAIEAAVVKSLSDAGLKVMRNADEDTYVYVQVTSGTVSPGLCVSRYDVFLYTNTTATLSYQAAPQLVQVSLLHKGGMTGGAPAAHGGAVAGAIRQYVDEFAKRIRAANSR